MAVVFLASCGIIEEPETQGNEGEIGYVRGFFGGVAADEPRAAVIGRDVLSSGGNAVDAAVAVYFALAVTKPSSASLGGGGVCVVHDPKSDTTEALEFFAKTPASIPPTASRPSAVPGNPRGFFALHAKYGKLRWEVVVKPGANLARFGSPVSRSTAADLNAAAGALSEDIEMIRVFGASGGGLVGEGDTLRQPDLAAVIGGMQVRGPGDFYSGAMARQLVDAAIAAGGSLELDDLRTFRPVWRETVRIPLGYHRLHVAPPPASAGLTGATMVHHLAGNDRFEEADEQERAHMLAEAGARAYGDRGRWLTADGGATLEAEELGDVTRFEDDMADYDPGRHTPTTALKARPVARAENPAATSFVTIDRFGGAVACGLTMNNFFGTGRVAPGTGVVLATIPGDAGRGPWSLSPILVINPITQHLFWASSATGGVAAPTASANVIARSFFTQDGLGAALTAKRVHHGGLPDTTYVEEGIGDGVVAELRSRGHEVTEARQIGRVNAFYCPEGLQNKPELCEVFTDPRGFGLSLSSER